MTARRVQRTHSLCTGAGCLSCKRIEAERLERISDLRDRLAKLDEPTRLGLLDTLVHTNPDAVTWALIESGAWPVEWEEVV